jgi:ribosomal protein L11 methyltransferase
VAGDVEIQDLTPKIAQMPYRLDLRGITDEELERLIELGALDIEQAGDGGTAALMPDSVPPEQIARVLGVQDISVSPAHGRDADSVWVLRPRPVRVGRLRIAPADARAEPGVLRLIDAAAFGTGLHPTTALCLQAIDETLQIAVPESILDVGTGSGVLALAALTLGVPRAMAVDIDDEALRVAGENARINGLRERLHLTRGGPEAAGGAWPLVLANILAAPLIEVAPAMVRRVGPKGRLVLSGIPISVERDVAQAYRRLGMRLADVRSRAGWTALVLDASW